MRRKELKNIAKKIAENETVIQTSNDKEVVEQAKQEILNISKKISFMDLDILDEMVMELLEK